MHVLNFFCEFKVKISNAIQPLFQEIVNFKIISLKIH